MKKHIDFIILVILQFCLFYVYPLVANRSDAIGMVIFILLGTFLLSILAGITKFEFKILYPVITVILFTPTIPLYYNFSASVHILWYTVVSYFGLGIGMLIVWLKNRLTTK